MRIHLASRRMFLKGSGTTLAIPFLASLLPRTARAQATTPVLRYVQVVDNMGATRAKSMPPQSMNPTTSIGDNCTARPLADYVTANGRISDIYGDWWNPVANKVNLVTNYHAYTATRGVHNISHATTGSGHAGADNTLSEVEQVVFPYSVDWVIEQAWKADARAFSAIRANFSSHFKYGNGNSHCFGGQKKALSADQNFAQLAQKLTSTSGMPTQNTAALQRRDFFNALMGDYRSVSQHPRLSSADKQRFSTYVDSINDIVRREDQAAMPRNCSVATKADSTNLKDKHDNAFELLANALACGVTRVASYALMAGSETDDDQEAFHPQHHNSRSSFDPRIQFRSQRVASFVQKLDAFKDESGESLLDHTVFYWGHEFSNCQDGQTDQYLGKTLSNGAHDCSGYTCILGGKAGGKLKTGQHVDAGHAPIGRILITAMQAAGLSTSQLERNGVVGFGEYSTRPNDIASQFGAPVIDRFLTDAEKRKPLPLLT